MVLRAARTNKYIQKKTKMKKPLCSIITVVSFMLTFGLISFNANAQYYKLKGHIKDSLKNPLENIMVCIENNEKKFKMTRPSGKFSLKVHKDDTLLMLSPNDEVFQIKLNGREEVV